MKRFLPISLLVATAIMAAAPAANAGSSGMSAGKVSYSDLSVMISLEKASPLLHLAVADGEPIDTLELTFRAPTTQARAGERLDYMTITMKDVLVSGYQTSAKETSLSLNFTKITYTYAPMSGRNLGGANFAFADGSVRVVR